MKFFRIGTVLAVLILATAALAKLSLPNGVLGQAEGALDFCAQADPESAEKYQEKKKDLVQGVSAKELAEARASQDYKDGYKTATDEMSKQSKDEVKKTCSAALESNNN